MGPRGHRPRDRLPRWLHDAVFAISGRREHNMGHIWLSTCAQAAADVVAAERGLVSHPLPSPQGWWDDEPQEWVRWRQAQREELAHERLITGPGRSSRTAILVCAALAYVAADGDLLALMRYRPPGEPWRVDDPRVVSHPTMRS